jgi:hypothetical protein
MAVSQTGVPLGILKQKQWVRLLEEFGKKKDRKKKPTEAKESFRWVEFQDTINVEIPAEKTVIHITDREGDEFDFLQAPRGENQHILLRCAQDRCIDNELNKIKAALENEKPCGIYHVEVGRKNGHLPRNAELTAKYLKVKILPPAYRSSEKLEPVELTAIKVYEANPTDEFKNEAIEWYLLTTLPVESLEEVEQCVKFYALRWLIERYHYTLKSGCRVEELQLETAGRLENAIAIFSIVAWFILYLTYLARIEPEVDARAAFTDDEIKALKLKFKDKIKKNGNLPLTIRQAVIFVASIGGFMARKSDGMPGVKTLWRGLLALEYLVEGMNLAKSYIEDMPNNKFPPQS